MQNFVERNVGVKITMLAIDRVVIYVHDAGEFKNSRNNGVGLEEGLYISRVGEGCCSLRYLPLNI